MVLFLRVRLSAYINLQVVSRTLSQGDRTKVAVRLRLSQDKFLTSPKEDTTMLAKNTLRAFALIAALAVVGSPGIMSPADATPSAAPTTNTTSAFEPSSPGLSYDDSSKDKQHYNAIASRTEGSGTSSSYGPNCTTTNNGGATVTTCLSGSSQSTSDADADVDQLRINGRLVGEYLVESGLTREQIGSARCYTSTSGWNTMRLADGTVVKYRDTRPQRICHTGVGPSGWQVVKCGNTYWPGSKPPKRYRTVRHPVVVKSFKNYTLHGRLHVETKTASEATSKSTAVCTSGTSESSAKAYAFASSSATLRFTFRGKSEFEAESNRVREQYELDLNVKAYAEAESKVKTMAGSTASCTTTEQPPAVNQPPTGEIVQFPAHLYPSGEYRVKVVGSDPEDGGNVSLSVSVTGAAYILTDASHPVVEDIEGTNRVRYFWIKAGSSTGDATITLTVNATGNNPFAASKTFPVVADQFRASARPHQVTRKGDIPQ